MDIHRTFINAIRIGTIGACLLMSACDSGEKLADVGDKRITKEQFEAYLKLKRLDANDEQQRQVMLDQYLEREALAVVIEDQELLDSEMTAAELNEFRKEMLISRYFEKFLADRVGDDAVTNYYNTHAADYEARKVRVAHILFRVNQNMDEVARKAKLTAAQEAYSKIKAGQSFEEAAKAYSEDTVSGKKDGDLGWLAEGAIDKRFSDKIFNMQADEVSEPFETNFGFHIVKMLEGPMVVKQPFETVMGRIRHQLRNEAKEAELKRLLELTDIDKD
jgi:peptidyl-prolyl cis-trans isomerase C